MSTTYKAMLKGDYLEWSGIRPELPPDAEGVPVYVVVPASETNQARAQRGKRMAAILTQLAESGGVTSIPDPAAWQREIRRDRTMPGRDQ